jgi:uncharacterized membrane-anchored protein
MLKFSKYTILSGVASLADLLAFSLLLLSGMHYLYATPVGFIVGAGSKNLLCNRFLFSEPVSISKSQFFKHLVVAVISLAITIGVMFVAVDLLQLNPLLARVISMGISLIATYSITLKFIYPAR